jgi:ketosteroid isomerase-like protein
MSSNVDVVLRTIRAVERRDARALLALYHPEVEMHHAPSLPYGGTRSGLNDIRQDIEHNSERTWLGTWGPLQPTQEQRSIDPRVVAATDREVVVLYRQRGLDPAGERFDAPVIGPYEVHDGKFARAQMFHFDTPAVVNYLTKAQQRLGRT